MSCGSAHTCALHAADGTVSCWGYGPYFSGISGSFVQVSAGNSHVCGLRSSGVVECYGDADHSVSIRLSVLSVPVGELFGYVSAGDVASCGVTIDGRIVCWGLYVLTGVPTGANFKYVATSSGGACAITSSGAVVCWGTLAASAISMTNALRLSASGHSVGVCALSVSGGIACSGDVANGNAGMAPPPTEAALVQVSVGYARACGINPTAGAVCWGLTFAFNVSSALLTRAVFVSVGYYVLCVVSPGGSVACASIFDGSTANGGVVPTGVSWRTVCAPGSVLTGGLPGTCTPAPSAPLRSSAPSSACPAHPGLSRPPRRLSARPAPPELHHHSITVHVWCASQGHTPTLRIVLHVAQELTATHPA